MNLERKSILVLVYAFLFNRSEAEKLRHKMSFEIELRSRRIIYRICVRAISVSTGVNARLETAGTEILSCIGENRI